MSDTSSHNTPTTTYIPQRAGDATGEATLPHSVSTARTSAATTTMGDIAIGDRLPGPNGSTCVTRAYEVHTPDTMWLMTFDNGEERRVSGNHLWYVESWADRRNHKNRVRRGHRLFKHISPQTVALLRRMAVATPGTLQPVTLSDMASWMEGEVPFSREMRYHLSRIAQSIGPVQHDVITVLDMYDSSVWDRSEHDLFDPSMVADQILMMALPAWSVLRRRCVIVGRVITTTQLSRDYSDVDLPTMKNPLSMSRYVERRLLS